MRNGPRVVAIGGGHGLARSLGAIRHYAGEITAIVSVADDGGSSGRLREAFDIPAPGDLRKCIGALLPQRTPLGDALEHRFDSGELGGHAFGNLLIAVLAATAGDFEAGVASCCALLDTVGAVVPATAVPVVLKAEARGAELEGQARIMATPGVSRVSIVPEDAPVPAAALAALAGADQIVIGPGSLYTSVLAACVPGPIAEAIAGSLGVRTYVANLRVQVPETAGYDIGMHVAALIAHGITPDAVVADPAEIPLGSMPDGLVVIERALSRPNLPVHDEARLADALAEALGARQP